MSRSKFKYKSGYHHPVENDELAELHTPKGKWAVEDKARRARAYKKIRERDEEARLAHKAIFMTRKKSDLFYVMTNSGKRHLSPNHYVVGMVASHQVPRTLCDSLIKKCTRPIYVKGDASKVPDLCRTCERTYREGKLIFDNADDITTAQQIAVTYEVLTL